MISLLAALALDVRAAVVNFNFSGTISTYSNPSNALPANIIYGTPFTGVLTYDTTAVLSGGDVEPSPNSGDYYFNDKGGFILSVTIAGHTFASTKHGPADSYASIVIHNDYFGYDSFSVEDSFPNVGMDGGPLPGNPDSSGILITLQDASATALNTDALPLIPPMVASFPDTHRFEIIARKNGSQVFDLSGLIVEMTPASQPVLTIRPQPNKTIQLAWPLSVQGFTLQQNTNLSAGAGWQTNAVPILDTATEHTVTVSASGSNCFFRLISP